MQPKQMGFGARRETAFREDEALGAAGNTTGTIGGWDWLLAAAGDISSASGGGRNKVLLL